MKPKPTTEQLLQRIKVLEKELAERYGEVRRLLESEQTYRNLFEESEILSSIYDENGVCLLMNRNVAGLFGGVPEAFIGKTLDELHPEFKGKYWRDVCEVLESGEVRRYEGRVSFPTGDRWLLTTIHRVAGGSGGRWMAQVISIDITERKQIEDRLMLFKTAVEHSSDAIGMSTPDGKHWYQNEAFDRLFGDTGDYPPRTIYADGDVGREIFKTIMDGSPWAGEVKMVGRNGNVLDILLRAYAIRSDEGRVVGLVGTHTDITERKQAERALHEREERLRTLFVANPDPMVMYDEKGLVQYINPAFAEVFGWSFEALQGRRIPFVPEHLKEETARIIEKLYAARSTVRFEAERLTKDGRTLDVIVSAAVIKDSEGSPTGTIVNLTDISERKSLQAQYEQAQRMESLGTLAGGIAHDFNNLLMGIQGRASLMAMDLVPEHPFFTHVQAIETYVKSASDLTRQLLGFARGGKYEVKPLDINELVQSGIELFARTKKELQIEMRLAPSLPAVEADRRQIEQVLLNIYVNAWQAMPQGGYLRISTGAVQLDADACSPHRVSAGTFVRIAIADTGIGMDKAVRDRIFDPFFTTKEKSRGTGLGLASAFGIIRNHNGFITVDSKSGHGTTFTIHLPASAKAVAPERPAIQTLAQGTETVLLVDDEELVIDVGSNMLEKLGYTVISVRSGTKAIEILSQMAGRVDLVILDLIMPGMDGGKAFDRIREIDPAVRVLLSSGYARDGQAEAVMQKGCNGFIQKPFTIQSLSTKIRAVLDAPGPDR